MVKANVLAVLLASAAMHGLHADLDEDRFRQYSDGDLLEQDDWLTQGVEQEGAGYVNLVGRGEVRPTKEGGGKMLVWLAGHGGFEQTRFVKKFPATDKSKCQVEFEIKPGEAEAGQLFLDQQNVGAVTLRFVRGGIGLLDPSGELTAQIVDQIKWKDWVLVKLNVDFKEHAFELFIDENSVGTFPISENITAFDQVNIFGGGTGFETQLKDLKIQSVSKFK
jgi:hypothetical protein